VTIEYLLGVIARMALDLCRCADVDDEQFVLSVVLTAVEAAALKVMTPDEAFAVAVDHSIALVLEGRPETDTEGSCEPL
jgi:hypothetical protein